MNTIMVVDYDLTWPAVFEELRLFIWPSVSDLGVSIEHVGSTSVPGLAAKPVIDIGVVVPTVAEMPAATNRLAVLGYVHQGNLGVEGREAFRAPDSMPRHHLYLCFRNSLALRNHLAVRDCLRGHPEMAKQYGELKQRLARAYPEDIDAYTEGKTEAIIRILEAAGFRSHELATIERINRRAI